MWVCSAAIRSIGGLPAALEPSVVAKFAYAKGLRAFQRLADRGERRGDAFRLCGLQAETDHDGYGITLTDGTVRARFLFHGRFAIASPNRRALEAFQRRVDRLLEATEEAA